MSKVLPGAKVLPPKELRSLIMDPLLRSSDALSGLFHRGVVVGEADADRAFYSEVNRRLVAVHRGSPDTFFANAQNWQTVPRIVGPLRQLGVPAVAVLDFDVLCGQKTEWDKIYKAANIDVATQTGMEATRVVVKVAMNAVGKEKFKQQGVNGLNVGDRPSARSLLSDLEKYGVFVVSTGELESWLPSLGVTSPNKAKWIVDIFNTLGSNPTAPAYVNPDNSDVWKFVDRFAAWISDPNRLGMP